MTKTWLSVGFLMVLMFVVWELLLQPMLLGAALVPQMTMAVLDTLFKCGFVLGAVTIVSSVIVMVWTQIELTRPHE